MEIEAQLSGFPFFPVDFGKDGRPVDPAQAAALRDHLLAAAPDDLLVLSHGWNNDKAEALDLYRRFLATARELIGSGTSPLAASRRLAVLGVFWPSKKFAERELIPGGAAGLGGVDLPGLTAALRELHGVFDAEDADTTLGGLEALLPRLEDSGRAREEFVEGVRRLVGADAAGEGSGADSPAAEPDGADDFFSLPAGEVFRKLELPVCLSGPLPGGDEGGASSIGAGLPPLEDPAGPAAEGGAAGLGGFFSGVGSAAFNLLNFITYYQMKERAGLVGVRGLNPLLRSLQQEAPGVRLHLAGHSFGGRLVTAAMAGPDGAAMVRAHSLSLLQAAYSHYGLAERWDGRHDGLYRRVLSGGALAGPVVITCTKNDRAVGLAYPIASLLAGQVAAGLGDENDRYGGMGRNGAQKTPEAVAAVLGDVGTTYPFAPGRAYNLRADAFVKGHGDITNPQVVHAVLAALA